MGFLNWIISGRFAELAEFANFGECGLTAVEAVGRQGPLWGGLA